MERILVVDDEPITRMDISEILKEANYNVVGEAKDGYEAIEKCEQYKPDFVIMDVKMPLLDGLKAAKVINEKKLSRGVVLLTAYSNKEFIEEAKKIGIIGYIIKPIDEKSFIPNLEIIFSKQEEFEKLEDRRKIDIAKSILMRNQNLSENEAYEYIRNLSMNKRTDMGKIADIIILTGENND